MKEGLSLDRSRGCGGVGRLKVVLANVLVEEAAGEFLEVSDAVVGCVATTVVVCGVVVRAGLSASSSSNSIDGPKCSKAKAEKRGQYLSRIHCMTKRLGASMQSRVSATRLISNGLIQVMNCCAGSSFSNSARQWLQYSFINLGR